MKTNENTTIGERIKFRRKELKLTTTDIKNNAGISVGTLSEIENNIVVPSSKTIIKLSQVLECSTDYILLGKNKGQNKDGDIRANRLLTYFYAMSEESKEDILYQAEYLARKGGAISSNLGKNKADDGEIEEETKVLA